MTLRGILPRLNVIRALAPRITSPLLPTTTAAAQRLHHSPLTNTPRPVVNSRYFTHFPARLSSNPSSSSSDSQNEPPPNATLSQKLKHLIKAYGWYALGVYFFFSTIDFTVAFIGINLLGAEYVSHAVNTVKSAVMDKFPTRPPEPGLDEIDSIKNPNATGGHEGFYAMLVLAYTVHKTLFLPVRIGLTAAFTPRLVGCSCRLKMSLARRAVFSAARLTKPTCVVQRRAASSSSHDDHGHHEEHDSTVYPSEGFGNTFWRNVVLISLAGVAAAKFAPAPNDEVYLTRWIAMYTSPRDYWLELNAKHTAQQAQVSEDHLLVGDAHRPAIHRFRYPQFTATMLSHNFPFLIALLVPHNVFAIPEVDFERMGSVGLAGAFAGLDLFTNTSASFDSSSSTLLSRAADGSLTRIASTNQGGNIVAGCVLDNIFYLAGQFSSINGVSASNIASYTPSSGAVSPVATNGPNGQINTLFCDDKENKLWVGGSFSSPGSSIAIYDPRSQSWSPAPFQGISGAQARVDSITTNSSQSSLFFSGSFITAFGNGNVVLNGTNNPNVPFSAGASPFSSSLVPVPLANAQVDGSPSSSQSGFDNINNVLCPDVQNDGPGNSWFAADNSTPLITVRTFSFLSASGVRLGNTFLGQHATTGFSVTTIPDNNVRTLKFLDPTTGQNQTCRDPCPLSTDSSILYQDFLFDDGSLSITGVQIKLSSFAGSAPGLHILQLLSSGAFASSIPDENGQSCFAPNPSNTTQVGNWSPKVAKTDIPGTVQTVLVSSVAVGTPANDAPSFTWYPYVSASGNYDVRLLVPGCINFADCASRTTVKLTVFVGPSQPPIVMTVSQQTEQDAMILLYSGPLLPSSPNFVAPITMTLADSPAGTGQNGRFELVADRVELVLTSATLSAGDGQSNTNAPGLARGFGFLEWDRSATAAMDSVDGRRAFPNSTLSGLDAVGFDVLAGLGGLTGLSSSDLTIKTVAHHSSGIYLGGNFRLGSGPASGASNVVIFKNGALTNIANNGLNGPIAASFVFGDQIFVGGSFTNTASGSSQGLNNIAVYNVPTNTWSALLAGVNGAVSSLNVLNGQLQITGNFTQILSTSGNTISTSGFAMWDISSSTWVNSGGFVVGSMTFIGNGTDSQFVAGNVQASQRFGATGLVMLKNGNSDGPAIAPLSVDLTPAVNATPTPGTLRKRDIPNATAFLSHIKLSQIFARQTAPAQQPLAPSLPAPGPAVLAGAFWTNSSSSQQLTILGGNFSFVAAGSSTVSQAVAIYDPSTGTAQGLAGPQISGTVRTLLVVDNSLYVGGEFSISGSNVNGLALYDLVKNEWDFSSIQALQPNPDSTVVVRSITKSASKATTVIVAGSFANAGALRCAGICSYDTTTNQWNALGNGIQGEVADVAYADVEDSVLIAAGSISLDGTTSSNVLRYHILNSTWDAVGSGSEIPGPVSAIEVNDKNSSSIFAAGSNGENPFLAFWNGNKWSTLDSSLSDGTTVAQLTMVPLQNTHTGNDIIQSDRMLMISGLLSTADGNVSSALFDGEKVIPYIVATSSTGSTGTISSLFHSISSFSFNKRRFLATGVVILISIAIAAGIVFLLALIGILWTLFSRKDDKLNKFDNAEEDDDDSQHHRPSSLLEHINAATRTTILGAGGPYSPYSSEKEEEKVTGSPREADPFVADGSNYVRAETPSDAMGGMLAEESSRLAHARYSFDGTGEGELPLTTGAEVEVLDDRDAAWWYARDVRTGKEGVVPAAYLY
ncbi:hypothetical protein CVT24_009712 [Panaeolus cyanescens]|uniref:SH3 domain-containing protein n=1 Tax=Panaeolus cyanescens TaxID=181874 RepID=A0A409Y9R3_9AGAR|nr:hypothetical protein CVT24_009712 [Panaeolus cyanescens]